MHEHQNQRGRGRGRGRGGEHAARRGSGSGFGFHTDAHLSQNQAPVAYAPNSNLYNYASGTNPNYPAINQSGLNTQPTSYSNSLHFVPSSVKPQYPPTNYQHFDQPVRLHQFTLPIRTSRVESTVPDGQHQSDNQASQTHYSGISAQPVPQPGYYGPSAPGTQVSLHAFALPIRNHPRTHSSIQRLSNLTLVTFRTVTVRTITHPSRIL
jgi:hypothetical protein